MKKLLASFFTIAIVCVFSGILTVSAEMNHYPEHDVNANGETDVFDLIQMKNQLLNEKAIPATVDKSDIIWFKGNQLTGKAEIQEIFANDDPAYTEQLLKNSRKLKGEGNYIVLLTDENELLNVVFETCMERTSDMQIIWYLYFDNIPYYICKDNSGNLLYCKDNNKYYFSNIAYSATQVKRFLEIVGEKDIEAIDFNCYNINFKDNLGRTAQITFDELTNTDVEPGYNTFEFEEYYLTVYENMEGKFAVNVSPRHQKKVLDYSNVEVTEDTMLELFRIMKNSIVHAGINENEVYVENKEGDEFSIIFGKVTYDQTDIGEFWFGNDSTYYVFEENGKICCNLFSE